MTPRVHQNGKPLELIYLGLMEAPRGIATLIDGVARARANGVQVNLTLIGSGREKETFERRAAATGLGADVIRFLGRVQNAEALRLLQNADVGVVPHIANESWNTTIPNKLFDYMAGGLAVLCSNAKPAARVVRETGAGLVYTDTNVEELTQAITQLADAQLRAEMGRRGREAVARQYNWEEETARMLEAVDSTVARGPR
jgi:glycosyltransferase involved in cell wall biosynthesis